MGGSGDAKIAVSKLNMAFETPLACKIKRAESCKPTFNQFRGFQGR
jgi:hypothetical protein